jgi:hypothetical protein
MVLTVGKFDRSDSVKVRLEAQAQCRPPGRAPLTEATDSCAISAVPQDRAMQEMARTIGCASPAHQITLSTQDHPGRQSAHAHEGCFAHWERFACACDFRFRLFDRCEHVRSARYEMRLRPSWRNQSRPYLRGLPTLVVACARPVQCALSGRRDACDLRNCAAKNCPH